MSKGLRLFTKENPLMANERREMCSTSSVTREKLEPLRDILVCASTVLNTTFALRFLFIAKKKKTNHRYEKPLDDYQNGQSETVGTWQVLVKVWNHWNSHTCCCWRVWVKLLCKIVWRALWPTWVTPGHVLNRNASYVYPKTCTRTFLAALFMIAPNWKLFQRPATTERLNTLYFGTKKFYSANHSNMQ